jgi:hypothetical protein
MEDSSLLLCASVITVRHNFTTRISVGCMKPNLQEITWFECREISKEEPLR